MDKAAVQIKDFFDMIAPSAVKFFADYFIFGDTYLSISYFYGVTMLTDILRGAESDRITKFKLNKVKEYAAMSNWDREDVTAVIYWLIDNHYILRTKEQYPVMHPTHEGQNYSEHITVGQLKKLNLYLSE